MEQKIGKSLFSGLRKNNFSFFRKRNSGIIFQGKDIFGILHQIKNKIKDPKIVQILKLILRDNGIYGEYGNIFPMYFHRSDFFQLHNNVQ